MTLTDLFDDPTLDDEDREFTEEEMNAVAEEFTLSDDYNEIIFAEVPLERFDKDAEPFGYDIADLYDWDSMDYEVGD